MTDKNAKLDNVNKKTSPKIILDISEKSDNLSTDDQKGEKIIPKTSSQKASKRFKPSARDVVEKTEKSKIQKKTHYKKKKIDNSNSFYHGAMLGSFIGAAVTTVVTAVVAHSSQL